MHRHPYILYLVLGKVIINNMWVVFKMKHYIDESECEIMAVFKNEDSAKQFAEMQKAEYKRVPYFA